MGRTRAHRSEAPAAEVIPLWFSMQRRFRVRVDGCYPLPYEGSGKIVTAYNSVDELDGFLEPVK
jgi:hypothetical protein